jgi:hypothetical protein
MHSAAYWKLQQQPACWKQSCSPSYAAMQQQHQEQQNGPRPAHQAMQAAAATWRRLPALLLLLLRMERGWVGLVCLRSRWQWQRH